MVNGKEQIDVMIVVPLLTGQYDMLIKRCVVAEQ
jgi:hypothetical protein